MPKALARDERKTVGSVAKRISGRKTDGRGAVGAVRRVKSGRWERMALTVRSRSTGVCDSRTKYISVPVTATMILAR